MSADIIAEALTWEKTPYHHQGRLKGVGVDCAMILADVYHAVGLIPYIDPRPYPQDWHLHRGEERYLDWLERYADQVDEPQPGDVALYRFGRTGSHGAIVIEWPRIIHAYRGQGVVQADGTKGELEGRLVGFWRVRGGS